MVLEGIFIPENGHTKSWAGKPENGIGSLEFRNCGFTIYTLNWSYIESYHSIIHIDMYVPEKQFAIILKELPNLLFKEEGANNE